MTTMTLDGFVAELTVDVDAGVIHGEVINTRAVLTFSASSMDMLKEEFARTLKEYRAWCAELGEEPEKPYSGTLSLRLGPELHRKVALSAVNCGVSVNAFIISAVENAISTAEARNSTLHPSADFFNPTAGQRARTIAELLSSNFELTKIFGYDTNDLISSAPEITWQPTERSRSSVRKVQ